MLQFLRVAPVVLFIIVRWVFDAFAVPFDAVAKVEVIADGTEYVNWQVFYFILLDLCWILNLIYVYWVDYSHLLRRMSAVLMLSFFIDGIINLTKFGIDINTYFTSLVDYEQNILLSGLITSLLLIIWPKQQLKKLFTSLFRG